MDVEASVVIPVYNAEELLQKSVGSALAQRGVRLEVVLVNDGSTDGSLGVMQELAQRDPRIRVIHYEDNQGEPHARNVGIEAARGEWIATMDADDWIAPDRLSVLIKSAKIHQVDMVADDMFLLGCNTGPLMTKRLLRRKYRGKTTIVDKELFIKESMPRILTWSWGFTQPVYRRDVLLGTGVRYDEVMHYSGDWDFICNCMLHGMRFLIIGMPFYYYEPNRPGSLTDVKRGPGIFNLMLRSTNNMIQIARQTDAREALRLLLIRKYRLTRLHEYLVLSYSIRSGNFGDALRYLAEKPSLLPRFILQSANGLWVRLLSQFNILLGCDKR
jgi:succinoglycan biosynthesis protein ExoO